MSPPLLVRVKTASLGAMTRQVRCRSAWLINVTLHLVGRRGGMIRGRDQGDAAVWAAALGIAGTLAGALGGALVQGRVIRRQVRDQEPPM